MKKSLVTIYRRLLRTMASLGGRKFPFEFLDASVLQSCIGANREALKSIDDWVPAQLLETSVFRYGVNPDVQPLLNLSLDAECTHTDVLAAFGKRFPDGCRYLELGVSVGKTLWQILHTCGPCECWGFDIEEMNPVLKAQLQEVSREEWETPPTSLKKTPSSISRFIHPKSGSKVVYVCADIFDERAWALLAKQRFNLVLSDALHTPEALDFEWAQMTKQEIFDERETVIVWDDLDGPMREWFDKMKPAIARYLGIAPDRVDTAFINGWLGRREFPHRLGFAIKSSPLGAGK